jgi:hypothetical protein
MALAGIVESHGFAPTISDVDHEVNDSIFLRCTHFSFDGWFCFCRYACTQG